MKSYKELIAFMVFFGVLLAVTQYNWEMVFGLTAILKLLLDIGYYIRFKQQVSRGNILLVTKKTKAITYALCSFCLVMMVYITYKHKQPDADTFLGIPIGTYFFLFLFSQLCFRRPNYNLVLKPKGLIFTDLFASATLRYNSLQKCTIYRDKVELIYKGATYTFPLDNAVTSDTITEFLHPKLGAQLDTVTF